ncbi:MAG TPA: hypothetical protein VGT78_09440 [Rhizomicrobium sp.]|nr:hypothetical protein [Rhizomicrobium sp.]
MNIEWEIGHAIVLIGGLAFGFLVANQTYRRSRWFRRESGWAVAALVAIFLAGATAVYAGVAYFDRSDVHDYSDDDSN